MFKGIIRILISYSLIIFSLLLSISLASFSPNDLSFYTTSPNTPPLNTLGSLGTYITTPFVFFYGKSSWVWAIFSLFMGIRLLTGITPKDLFIRFALTHYLSLMLATFVALFDSSSSFLSGGIFGVLIANQLMSILPNIIWIPFVAFAFILGFFGFFHFPHVLFQKLLATISNRIQAQKLVTENIPTHKLVSVERDQDFATDYGVESSAEDKQIETIFFDEELGNVLPSVSSSAEQQGFIYQKQVPSFLQEIDSVNRLGIDDQDDIPIYLTKKRITKPQPFIFREVEVDLLAPYFRSQNPFYKQLEQNQESLDSVGKNAYQPKLEVLQDMTEGLDELEQSSEIMLPTSEWVREVGVDVLDLINHKHPATRLSFSQGFVEEELEIEDLPIYKKKDTDQKTNMTVDKENYNVEQDVQEEVVFSVPQHISNFPPVDSFTRDPLILKELDDEGNEIENTRISSLYDMVSTPMVADQLSDSEKILVQGLERTTLRNKNKIQGLKEKLHKKHQELASVYHQTPKVANPTLNTTTPEQANQDNHLDIQDSLKLYSLEQEIIELKKDSSLGITVSQAIEDGSFLKQHQEYALDNLNLADDLSLKDDILAQENVDLSESAIPTDDLLQELMMPVVEEDSYIKDILSAIPEEILQETDLLADLYTLNPLEEDIESSTKLLEEDLVPLTDTDMEKEDLFSEIENLAPQPTVDQKDRDQTVNSENHLDEEALYIDFDDITIKEYTDSDPIDKDEIQNDISPIIKTNIEVLDPLSESIKSVPMSITVEQAEPSFSFLEGVVTSRQSIPVKHQNFSNPSRGSKKIQEDLIVIDSSEDEDWGMSNSRVSHDKHNDFTLSNIHNQDKAHVEVVEDFPETGNFMDILNLDDEDNILTEPMDFDGQSFVSKDLKKEKRTVENTVETNGRDDILAKPINYYDEAYLTEDSKDEKFVIDSAIKDANIDGRNDILAEPMDYYDETFLSEDPKDEKRTIENFTDILNLDHEDDIIGAEPIESVEKEIGFTIPIDPDNEIEKIFAANADFIGIDTNNTEHITIPLQEENDIIDLQEPESLLMPSVTTDTHLMNPISYPIPECDDTTEITEKVSDNIEDQSTEGSSNTLIFPRIEDLEPNTDRISQEEENKELEATMKMIEDTYESFNINMQVVDYNRGPTITRFELEPPSGLKLRTILNLQDDLALQAGTSNLRIISPVEGRSLIGIEVPNKVRRNFLLREQVESELFQTTKAALPLILGVDVGGKEIVGDLATTPHLLIAGTTGSGKSVYVNALIMGLLFKLSSEDLKFIMIDPKMVELELYSGIPHLLAPIITKPEEAMAALDWAVQEMDRRYKLLSTYGVRNIKEYQELIKNTPLGAETYEKLPYIVIIVDEFASLMLRAPKDTEKYISRLASMSRAVGIHLVLATQRPSVDVVTGVIKANFPSRIAFRVSSKIDSRTIVDKNGAETLLGRGDMLFMSPEHMDLIRIQSPYASSEDIARAVSTVKKNGPPNYTIDFSEVLARQEESSTDGSRTDALNDPLFEEVLRYAVDNGEISASGIQRRFRVGYNRASRLIESMKDMKIISPPPSAGKGWLINITRDEIMDYID